MTSAYDVLSAEVGAVWWKRSDKVSVLTSASREVRRLRALLATATGQPVPLASKCSASAAGNGGGGGGGDSSLMLGVMAAAATIASESAAAAAHTRSSDSANSEGEGGDDRVASDGRKARKNLREAERRNLVRGVCWHLPRPRCLQMRLHLLKRLHSSFNPSLLPPTGQCRVRRTVRRSGRCAPQQV